MAPLQTQKAQGPFLERIASCSLRRVCQLQPSQRHLNQLIPAAAVKKSRSLTLDSQPSRRVLTSECPTCACRDVHEAAMREVVTEAIVLLMARAKIHPWPGLSVQSLVG